MPTTFINEEYIDWINRNNWQTTTGTININANDNSITSTNYVFNYDPEPTTITIDTNRWYVGTSYNSTVNFHVKEKEKEFDSDSKELDEFLAGYKRSKE